MGRHPGPCSQRHVRALCLCVTSPRPNHPDWPARARWWAGQLQDGEAVYRKRPRPTLWCFLLFCPHPPDLILTSSRLFPFLSIAVSFPFSRVKSFASLLSAILYCSFVFISFALYTTLQPYHRRYYIQLTHSLENNYPNSIVL